MQVPSEPDVAGLLDRSMADELPGGRGLAAWQALLRSHATLMRQLERDLAKETGLALADFDVLAQLALAGGALRMTELADRALISRSGMTRRVARLVDVGLVRRANADGDARGVVVAVTDAGVEYLKPLGQLKLLNLYHTLVSDGGYQTLRTALPGCRIIWDRKSALPARRGL